MAASDYVVKGTSGFCPMAILASSIGPTVTNIPLSKYNAIPDDSITEGSAVLMNEEIMKVVSFTNSLVVVERGCADTIPQSHPVGSQLWFFDDAMVSDNTEYGGTSTISVKLLPKTASGNAVPTDYAYPHDITFNNRFVRPYPPGKVRVNDAPFSEVQTVTTAAPNLTITWKHRNRITQADILFGHENDSMTPEVGQSYTIRFYKVSSTGVRTLIRTETGLTADAFSYARTAILSDMGFSSSPTSVQSLQFELESVRDSYTSLQKYIVDFLLAAGTPQINELVFGGTVDPGAIVTVNAGSSTYTYTIIAGDTLTSIATKIAQAIAAADVYMAVSSAEHVTITGKTASSFLFNASVDAAGAGTPAAISTMQAPSSTLPKIAQVDYATTMDSTKILNLAVGSHTYSYPIAASDTGDMALTALATKVNHSVASELPFTPWLPTTRVVTLNGGAQYLMMSGVLGSNPLSHVMTSSDSGLNFTTYEHTENTAWAGQYGLSTMCFDGKYGTRRFSILRSDAGYSTYSVITQDGNAEPVMSPSSENRPNTGSNEAIFFNAGYADTDKMYLIGNTSEDDDGWKCFLYSTVDGLTCTRIGQLTLSPSTTDPNDRFRWAYTKLGKSTLLKNNDRWFLQTRFGLYYTDDAVPLANWKHIVTGLGETAANTELSYLKVIGNTLIVGTYSTYYQSGQIAYSTDNGTSWSNLTVPSSLYYTNFYPIVAAGDYFYGYYNKSNPGAPLSVGVIKIPAANPTGFTLNVASGFPSPLNGAYAWNYGSSVLMFADSTGSALRTSVDGVTFTATGVPEKVAVLERGPAVASVASGKLVLTGENPNTDFTVSANWKSKALTTVTYSKIQEGGP